MEVYLTLFTLVLLLCTIYHRESKDKDVIPFLALFVFTVIFGYIFLRFLQLDDRPKILDNYFLLLTWNDAVYFLIVTYPMLTSLLGIY